MKSNSSRKILYSVLLFFLLVGFPLVSYYYLKKGFNETVGVQNLVSPLYEYNYKLLKDQLDSDSFMRHNIFAEHFTLIGFNLTENECDSLSLVARIFDEDTTFQFITITDTPDLPDPTIVICSDNHYFGFRGDSNALTRSIDALIVDTVGMVIYETELHGIEDYQLLTKALALQMPRKKRKEIVFQREQEK